MGKRKKVIIVGAGFGGLFSAKKLAGKDVDVILVDKNNYHTFTPLLYQVATCALDPSEIAYPIRAIFRKYSNVKTLLGEVVAIDPNEKNISIQMEGAHQSLDYDYLILAGGSQSNYFGNDQFSRYTYDLKSLSDAVELRNHVLRSFEKAIWATTAEEREALLTFVVIGGGPTGIETAGALYELYNHVLSKEYKDHDLRANVIIVEMASYVLSPYPHQLRMKAMEQLNTLGITLEFENPVVAVDENKVVLQDGKQIRTSTVVWSVGVKGAPLGNLLNVGLEKGNRIPVDGYMRVKGFENIYAVGDMTHLESPGGSPYPQMIPVAQQQAEVAAGNILAAMNGASLVSFEYHDRGIMATIGRSRAVAWLFNRFQITGFVAWLVWLFFHLISLVGFRNRISVLISWIWNYLTYDRSVRIILDQGNMEDIT
ncbi:NAD(P)/FAD-dependent oxidoreductase [bacterium]|nr:NAD(P)/FAD-dependent oxidoreductase [bacterium]